MQPENNNPLNVTIIGGGFCGVMTAVHLMNCCDFPLHIHIINSGYPFARGVAYSPNASCLLLNVPNSKMSAFPDMPRHFVNWLEDNNFPGYLNEDELINGFSERERFGNYISWIWDEAVKNKNNSVSVSILDDMAYDLAEDGSRFHVYLKRHHVITADYVVLATGNVQPRLPSGIPSFFGASKRYFGNPWTKDCIENLDGIDNILIIGNGLTMADTVLGLAEKGFAGSIHTASLHGYNLNPWKDTKPQYNGLDIPKLLEQQINLHELVSLLNKHRKIAAKLNQSFYQTIDLIRPYNQKIWQSASLEERQQFIKYYRHLWGSIRHRLPAKMHNFIQEMYAEKRLFTYKGTVVSLIETDQNVKITLGSGGVLKKLTVQRIINCTGPEGNVKLSANELLKNLEKKGVICPDALNMGVNACLEDGRVIDPGGYCRSNLYVIGSNLKGILWESTAVPELRIQAQNLANHLHKKIKSQMWYL